MKVIFEIVRNVALALVCVCGGIGTLFWIGRAIYIAVWMPFFMWMLPGPYVETANGLLAYLATMATMVVAILVTVATISTSRSSQ